MSKEELRRIEALLPEGFEGVQTAYVLASIRERRMTARAAVLDGEQRAALHHPEVPRRPPGDEMARIERAMNRVARQKSKAR